MFYDVLIRVHDVMQGCRSPLVVKLADSQKEKEMKRLQQMQAQLLNGAGAVGLGALSQQYLAVSSTYAVSHINNSFVLMNLLCVAMWTGLWIVLLVLQGHRACSEFKLTAATPRLTALVVILSAESMPSNVDPCVIGADSRTLFVS